MKTNHSRIIYQAEQRWYKSGKDYTEWKAEEKVLPVKKGGRIPEILWNYWSFEPKKQIVRDVRDKQVYYKCEMKGHPANNFKINV